jgi:hypothetical protein
VERREEVRRGLAIAAALALCAGTAAAQSAPPDLSLLTLTGFGLMGTWAQDCAKPPGKDNIYSRYEVKDGKVVNVHDAGPTFVEDVYTVRSARSAGGDLLAIKVAGKQGKETEITLRRTGAMMQVWRVVGADGFAPVNDGKYIVNDAVIPALNRCK